MKRAIRIMILVRDDQLGWKCCVVCDVAFGLVHGQLVMGKGDGHRYEEGRDEGTLI